MDQEHSSTGTGEVLDRWIAEFRGPLIGLLASWGGDWQAAEELAQDTFAEAWVGQARFSGSLDDDGAVGAWLRGIAFNLHRTGRRAEQRRPTLSLEGHDAPSEVQEPDLRHDALADGFRQLSAPHQTVLRMHYLEETPTKGVAALLGMTSKAVEGRLYQARIALRAELERAEARQQQEAL